MVRQFLDGRFENTAFCILDPTGKERLSGTGRSPNQGLSEGRRKTDDTSVIEKLNTIASDYQIEGSQSETVVQDFHSFRQALNVASGDQRLLLLVNAGSDEVEKVTSVLEPVMVDSDIVGKFHVDFSNPETDSEWSKAIEGEAEDAGYVIIRSGEFGIDGTALASLPLSSDAAAIKSALLAANQEFAELEKRKVYSEHVSVGRREGVRFENAMPYGEDRDGDGKIDAKGGKGKGKGKGKGMKGRRQ